LAEETTREGVVLELEQQVHDDEEERTGAQLDASAGPED
jgi:hypothetical protein